MTSVALLSNPRATGNQSHLPAIRAYCARHPDIFHYEVEDIAQIACALKTIARVKPKAIVVNGGDGTVQAALTELYRGGHFQGPPPPVAVLPAGKTNLIAHDLGAGADPIAALERVLELVRTDMMPHIVSRELIELSGGRDGRGSRPVLGMFLGGAGLADTMLYCRHHIYPLGLPNWLAHGLALLLGLVNVLLGRRSRLLTTVAGPIRISVSRRGQLQGKFAFLMVTTLERLLLNGTVATPGERPGAMQLLVIEGSVASLLGALFAAIRGRLGRSRIRGVHLARGDEIRIGGMRSNIILDGEMFEANEERPIVLRPTAPVPFLRLAA